MGTGKILLGVLAGVAAGATLGILLAPEKGEETRLKVKEQIDELGNLMVSFKAFLTNDIAVRYSNMMDSDIDFYGIKSELGKLIEKEKKSKKSHWGVLKNQENGI